MRRFYTSAALFLAALLFFLTNNATACTFKASFKGDTLITSANTGHYQTTKVSGHTYKWSASGGSISYTSTNKDSIQVQWSLPGIWSVKLQDSSGGCIDSIRIKVKVGLSSATLMASAFTTNGSASVSGKLYSVTSNAGSQVGSCWNKTKLSLNTNFDLTLTVNQGNPSACGVTNSSADGMVFVLQNTSPTAVGSTAGGSDMGYYNSPSGTFDQSFGMEFDIYQSPSGYYDSSGSHLSLVKNKSPIPLKKQENLSFSLLDCTDRHFRIVWNASAKQLFIYLNAKKYFTTYNIDLINSIFGGNPNVYFGFTGATGAITSTQKFKVDTFIIGRAMIASTANTTICKGDSLTLTASAGLGFLWSNGAKTRIIKVGKAGNYAVTITDSFNRVTTSDSVSVFVNPIPTVKAGSAQNSCIGGSAIIGSLPANSSYQYSWSSRPSGFSSSKSQDTVKATTSTMYYLTVLDKSTGCSKSDSVKIIINPSPTSSFTATGGCPGSPVSFTNNSTPPAGGKLTYLWKFDDGSTSTSTTPVKSFTKPGFHNIWLIVKSDSGCLDSSTQRISLNAVPNLSYSTSSACLGQTTTFTNNSTFTAGTATYLWKFGDGNTSTATTPTKVYSNAGTYKTWIVATTNKGCKDSIEQDVVVSAKPTSSFTFTGGCSPDSVRFTDNSSSTTGSITSFNWSFGDATTTTAENPAHKYKAGKYNVWLAVKGNSGCTDTSKQTITITDAPKAIIGGQNTCLTNSTQFTDSSTSPSGSTISDRSWSFGDQNTSTQSNPTHSYTSSGTYTIWLKVTGSTGCVDSTSKSLTIYPLPTATFTATKVSKRNYNFVATDKTQSQYDWTFGDNSNGTGSSTSHNYLKDSSFTVSLKVTSVNGCTKTSSQSIKVSTGIAPALSGDDIKMHLFPNPFNNQFTLNYTLTKPGKVRISLMDIQGREVALIAQSEQSLGEYNYIINAQDYNMKGGVYIVRLMIDDQAINKQMIQIK